MMGKILPACLLLLCHVCMSNSSRQQRSPLAALLSSCSIATSKLQILHIFCHDQSGGYIYSTNEGSQQQNGPQVSGTTTVQLPPERKLVSHGLCLWAAWYITRLLINLTPKGVGFLFLSRDPCKTMSKCAASSWWWRGLGSNAAQASRQYTPRLDKPACRQQQTMEHEGYQ